MQAIVCQWSIFSLEISINSLYNCNFLNIQLLESRLLSVLGETIIALSGPVANNCFGYFHNEKLSVLRKVTWHPILAWKIYGKVFKPLFLLGRAKKAKLLILFTTVLAFRETPVKRKGIFLQFGTTKALNVNFSPQQKYCEGKIPQNYDLQVLIRLQANDWTETSPLKHNGCFHPTPSFFHPPLDRVSAIGDLRHECGLPRRKMRTLGKKP